MDKSQLAGFGNRLVAQIIDGIILGIAFSLLMIPFGGMATLIGMNADNISDSSDEAAAALIGLAGLSVLGIVLFSLIAPFIYEAFMISSAKQATVGKIIMKIKVVGPAGERLTFGQAVGRSLIKYISSHLCILLWLWPLFNPEEQALHDLVIKSYVVKSA
ncbi:RDD family protein [Runella sp.]|uniref:RDD family protein n=1 Tax=Runella sp. TaxID=1960881 RepID=UPI003D0A948A